MGKILGMIFLALGSTSLALASGGAPVPEIDGASATSGLFLLAGVTLVVRNHLKK